MNKFILTVFCTSIICLTTPLYANSKTSQGIEYPEWDRFIDDKEHSRSDARCKEVEGKTGNIICTFNQVTVLPKNTSSVEKSLTDLKGASVNEMQKTINSMKKLCTEESEKSFQESFKLHPTLESQMLHEEWKIFCHDPSRNSLIKLFENNLQIEKSSCTIFDNTYTQEFKYSHLMKKWKNIEDGNGVDILRDKCGTIDVAYLEKDPRKGWDFSWNYRTRKIVTNKEGSALGSKCSKLTEGKNNVENEIISYGIGSLMYETNQLMNCKYMDLTEY